jgi:hypothetical protein
MPSLVARAPLPGESTFSLSIRRSTAAGIAVSLAVHLLALFLLLPQIKKKEDEFSEPPAPGPITAQIRLPSKAAPKAEPAPAQPEATPSQPPPPREPARRRPTPQRPTLPPLLSRRAPNAPTTAPPAPTRPLPPPFPQPPADDNPKTDMSANLNERRRKMDALQDEMASGNRNPSENTVAMNRIKENLKPDRGAGGVFRVSMGIRNANIYFNGWRGERKRVMEESFEVDAGVGGDVEGAVIRQIIAVIRRDYTTDFTWESHRLGGSRTLSARPEDTAELERFLRLEFAEVFASARSRR